MKRGVPYRWNRSFSPCVAAALLAACGVPGDDDVETQAIAEALATAAESAPAALGGRVDAAPPGTTVLAKTDWSFDVTNQGIANYYVPIRVPEGRVGMAPELGLEYDSRQGAGLLGPRWALRGLSAIRRCRQSQAIDGTSHPIDWSGATFCLNQDRLVDVRQLGTSPGAEFRPERDPFTNVEILQVDGQGPLTFKVLRRDGRIEWYGRSPSSRAEGVRIDSTSRGGRTRVRYAWYLDKIEDRKANSIVIEYTTDASSDAIDEPRPTRIDYTGLGDEKGTRQVSFKYKPVSLPSRYLRGAEIRNNQLLESIEVSAPTVESGLVQPGVVRSYRMSYRMSPVTNRLLLRSIQECDRSGAQAVCKKETSLEWEAVAPAFEEHVLPIHDVSPNLTYLIGQDPNLWGRIIPADVNGDGKDDILYRTTQDAGGCDLAWFVRLSDGSGFGSKQFLSLSRDTDLLCTAASATRARVPPPALELQMPYLGDILPIDIDRDGRMDLVVPRGDYNKFHSYRLWLNNSYESTWSSGGDVFDQLSLELPGTTKPSSPALAAGELDGDNRIDIVRRFDDKIGMDPLWVALEPGRFGLGTPKRLIRWFGADIERVAPMLFDVDGDGVSEVLRSDNPSFTAARSATMQVDDVGFPYLLDVRTGSVKGRHWFIDVNGDGLKDVAYVAEWPGLPGPETISVQINRGLGFDTPRTAAIRTLLPSGLRVGLAWSRNLDDGVRVIDYNLDGFEDLLLVDNGVKQVDQGLFAATRSNMVLLLSDGEGRFSPRTLTIPIGDHADGVDEIPAPFHGYRFTQTLDVNGDGLTDLVQLRGGQLVLHILKGKEPDVMVSATDGLGAAVKFTYEPVAADPSYLPDPAECRAQPLARCVSRGIWVVKTAETFAPLRRQRSYRYHAGYSDLNGRGFLGFKRVTVRDDGLKQETTRIFDPTRIHSWRGKYVYPLLGLPVERETRTLEVPALHRRETLDYEHEFLADGTFRLTSANSVARERDLQSGSSGLVRRVDQTATFDTAGNHTSTTTTVSSPLHTGRETRTTTVVFEPRFGEWLLSVPSFAVDTSRLPDGRERVRRIDFEADQDGWVIGTFREPLGSASEYLKTKYVRDGSGRITSITQTDRGGTARTTGISYDPIDGTFVHRVTNALGHVEQFWVDPGLGVLLRHRDAAGVVDRWQYDTLGRLRTIEEAAAGTTNIEYGRSNGNLVMTVAALGGPTVEATLDSSEREIVRKSKTSDGADARIYTQYDAVGFVHTREGPVVEGGSRGLKEIFEHDALGRPVRHCRSDENGSFLIENLEYACTSQSYVDLTRTTRDPNGNRSTLLADPLGRPKKLIRRDGPKEIVTVYEHTFFDDLLSIATEGADGLTTQLSHDVLGRQTAVETTGVGRTRLVYNAFDDLIRQDRFTRGGRLDPQGTISVDRDALGRVQTMRSPEGKTTYVWDTAPFGRGKLHTATTPDGVNTLHRYNGRGLVHTVKWTVGSDVYEIQRNYDQLGRVRNLTYPNTPGWPRLRVRHEYDRATGRLRRIIRDGTEDVLWLAAGRDASGLIEREVMDGQVTRSSSYHPRSLRLSRSTLGKGSASITERISYYQDGSVATDERYGAVEQFKYDGLNRLKEWNPDVRGGGQSVVYGYDAADNLRSRIHQNETITYDGRPLVRTVKRTTSNPTEQTIESYMYDHWGRLVESPAGRMTYGANDLLRRFDGKGRVPSFEFVYDAFGQRVVKRNLDSDQEVTSVGDLMDRSSEGASNTVALHVWAEGRIVLDVVRSRGGAGKSEGIRYFLQDAVGTVMGDAATDTVPRFTQRRDPFGNTLQGSSAFLPPEPRAAAGPRVLNRGFGGHPQDPEIGLIDMGARAYSPRLGRFVSADPLIQNPFDIRSHNPHSYALNNPTRYRDPDGRSPIDISFDDDIIFGGELSAIAPPPESVANPPQGADPIGYLGADWGVPGTGSSGPGYGYTSRGGFNLWELLFGGGGGGGAPAEGPVETIVTGTGRGGTGVVYGPSGGRDPGGTTSSLQYAAGRAEAQGGSTGGRFGSLPGDASNVFAELPTPGLSYPDYLPYTPPPLTDAEKLILQVGSVFMPIPVAAVLGRATATTANVATKLLPGVATTTAAAAAKHGLTLTAHAAARLAGREAHVTLKMVARTIAKGEKFFDPKNNSIVSVIRQGKSSILVGQNPTSGVVTTVISGSEKAIIRPRFIPLP